MDYNHASDLGNIKICDFGLSRSTMQSLSTTISRVGLGTEGYIAPEVREGHQPPTPASDIYALGVMLYEYHFNEVPNKLLILVSVSGFSFLMILLIFSSDKTKQDNNFVIKYEIKKL